jgi:hypothetical protein
MVSFVLCVNLWSFKKRGATRLFRLFLVLLDLGFLLIDTKGLASRLLQAATTLIFRASLGNSHGHAAMLVSSLLDF